MESLLDPFEQLKKIFPLFTFALTEAAPVHSPHARKRIPFRLEYPSIIRDERLSPFFLSPQ